MKVYIPTCDSHLFVIEAFSYFFNKYWGDDFEVKVLGFSEPDFSLPDNFEFVSMAKEQIGGAQGWSNYLIEYFNSIDDEHFIFGIDDFCIVRPFDRSLYEMLLGELNETVGRIDLQPSLQYSRDPADVSLYKECSDFDILELNQNRSIKTIDSLYRITAQFSIWNRKYFLRYLYSNWSPWDWEIRGSAMAEGDGYKILGTKDRWCALKIELLSDGQYANKINIQGMYEEDKLIIKEMYQDRSEEIGNFKNDYEFLLEIGENK